MSFTTRLCLYSLHRTSLLLQLRYLYFRLTAMSPRIILLGFYLLTDPSISLSPYRLHLNFQLLARAVFARPQYFC